AREVARDRLEVAQERVERLDRDVDRGAAAGEGVAEALGRLADRRSRLAVEGRVEVLELERLRGEAQRNRVAGGVALLGAAGAQLHVLEPQRRARADLDLGVLG